MTRVFLPRRSLAGYPAGSRWRSQLLPTRALAVALVCALRASSVHAEEPVPAVLLLPLAATGTVTAKQAEGATAQVRAAITPEVAKLLSSSAHDGKQAATCARAVPCLARIASLRGAELLGTGSVAPAADGLRVALEVILPERAGLTERAGPPEVRHVEVTLRGDAEDAARIDRLVRTAFNPSALRGWISVLGEAGALVRIDDIEVGALPLEPIGGLREGRHMVVVRKEGSGEFRRPIDVVHGENVEVKAVLVESEDAFVPVARVKESSDVLSTDVIVVGAVGAGLVVLGGVAGALSLRDGLEVEQRAAAQNLAFPTDSELYARGGLLALTANGLYLAGAVAFGAAAVLAVLE